MAMSEQQKILRRWFQRHRWSTGDTPTGLGVYLESPVLSGAGTCYLAEDKKTGEKREYSKEHYMAIELDRFTCAVVDIDIYERKHWWKRDLSVPNGQISGYSWVPSDDFEPWKRQPTASMSIPAKDILKLAELIQEAQKDCCRVRNVAYKPTLFSIAKGCMYRWLGVNTSYDAIKWTYSNERLRKEKEVQ